MPLATVDHATVAMVLSPSLQASRVGLFGESLGHANGAFAHWCGLANSHVLKTQFQHRLASRTFSPIE